MPYPVGVLIVRFLLAATIMASWMAWYTLGISNNVRNSISYIFSTGNQRAQAALMVRWFLLDTICHWLRLLITTRLPLQVRWLLFMLSEMLNHFAEIGAYYK